MSCKVLTRLFGVLCDRRAQGRQAFELGLVAQLPEEAYLQAPAVEAATALQQMHFEQRLRHRVHRRPQAHAGNTGPQALDLYDVNAQEWRPLCERNVGGGKTQIVPELRAVDHAPAERVRPSEQPLGAGEIARLERRAHRRARDALALEGHVGHRLEGEAAPLERGEVALALRAEAEVAPDEQPCG